MTKVLENTGGISRAAAAMSVLAVCGTFTFTSSRADDTFTLGGAVSGLRGNGLTLMFNVGWADPDFLTTFKFIDDPQVFLDAAGTAHVIWQHNDGTLVSSRNTPAVSWTALERIPTDGIGAPRGWRGGMDGAGNIIAIWNSDVAGTTSPWANRYVPGSGWGTPVQLEGGVNYVWDLDLAVDSGGNAVAFWRPAHNGQSRLMSRRYAPGSGWGTAEVVNTDDGGVGSVLTGRYRSGTGWSVATIETPPASMAVHTPRIGTDASGSALAVWITKNANNGGYARANVLE